MGFDIYGVNIMEERFVAFIDILGFKQELEKIESNIDSENKNLKRILSILNFIDTETQESHYSADLPIYVDSPNGVIEKELGDPRMTYISDCVIISTEPTIDGFKALSRKIHKIITDLAYDGFFCRGAISKGKLFHKDRIMFGSSYIRAYCLEEKVAKYPRVIIDPNILDFFDLSNESMPLAPIFYGKDTDGHYYLRYWTWYLFPPYAGSWINYIVIIRARIIANINENLSNPNILEKNIWLKNEYNSLIEFWGMIANTNFPKIEHGDHNCTK